MKQHMLMNMLMIGGATPQMLERMNASFHVHKMAEISDWDAFAAEHGDKIEAVSTNGHDGVKPEIMASLPNLKMISCYGVGYDAIDTKACVDRDIMVTHTPGVLNADVANLAVLLMLATSRCLLRDDQWVRSGNWSKNGNAPLTRSIENKKVGIIGLGRIGQNIATKLEAFGCDIAYHNRNQKTDTDYTFYPLLADMARDVDFLIVITPGGSSTNKLVNRDVLDALGPEGTLINVGRGTVVDEAEMVLALQEGRLGWAGLDVFENEPHATEALFGMENVVLTPHVASATVETRHAMGDLMVDNLIEYFEKGAVRTPVPECVDVPIQKPLSQGV